MFAIEDLGDYLESKGMGVVAETIWLNKLPDTPDNIISIFQGGGTPQPLKIKVFYPSFQLRARSISNSEALQTINQLYNLMDNDCLRRFVSPSGRVFIVKKLTPPFFYDTDDSDRSSYILSVDILTQTD